MLRHPLVQLGLIVLILAVLFWWQEIRRWLRDVFGARPGEAARRPAPSGSRPSPVEEERRQRYEAYAAEVAALSVEEARRRAEPILADTRFWRCLAAEGGDIPRSRELSQSLCDLFERFAAVEDTHSGARLGREEIEPYRGSVGDVLTFGTEPPTGRNQYLRIGRDPGDNPIVVRVNEEALFVVHKPLASGGRVWSTCYASVYHWILMRHFFQTEEPAA